MVPDFTLDQLAAFLAVVDEGSFTAAGRKLHRVQSAVSYAVGQLEGALGTTLFDRSGRTPALTDAGRRLAAEARLVLGRARDLRETAAGLQAGTEPRLHLAFDVAYPRVRLLELCARFSEAFPSVLLNLEVALMGDAVDAVLRRGADLAVCNLAGGAPAELTVAHLGRVVLVPVCAAAHPLAQSEAPQPASLLEQHAQIVQSERIPEASADHGVVSSRTWRVSELDLKADLIRRGVGWGHLPVDLAEPGLASGELVRLRPEPWPDGHTVALHAVVRRDRSLGRAGQWWRANLPL